MIIMSVDTILKLVTCGDGAVGKTTLLHRYVDGYFQYDQHMTIGVNILKKILEYKDRRVMLQLWDFGGQEQFRFMLQNYVLGASGAIIMFDLTRSTTTDSIQEWVDLVRGQNPGIPLILIGGKADLEPDSTLTEVYIEEIKEVYNFTTYLKTSSKTGENVDVAFNTLLKEIIESKFGGNEQ